MDNQFYVLKADGSKSVYDPEKLKIALVRAGATEQECKNVLSIVEAKLYDGVPTNKIYGFAYAQLKRQKSHKVAGRYRLKQAILDLGPSGYPFENFVGKLFESFGYSVKVGEYLQGKCVQHEVDVVANKPGEQVIVEIKFRGNVKGKINVQVPLYINSRFDDIKAKMKDDKKNTDLNVRGFVVTNGRFTVDALKYAECIGLGLISWDYPVDKSLKKYIDQSGLHPLTSLHSLKKTHKRVLLDDGLVLCRQLIENPDSMQKLNLSSTQISKVIQEAATLIRS